MENKTPTEIISDFLASNPEGGLMVQGSKDKMEVYGMVNENDLNPELIVTLHKLEGTTEDEFLQTISLTLNSFFK